MSRGERARGSGAGSGEGGGQSSGRALGVMVKAGSLFRRSGQFLGKF